MRKKLMLKVASGCLRFSLEVGVEVCIVLALRKSGMPAEVDIPTPD